MRRSRDGGEDKIAIPSYHLYTSVGPSPCIAITGVHVGSDWDRGKLFLGTEVPVRAAGAAFLREQLLARHMADELGWIWYILRNRDLDDSGKIKAIQSRLRRSKVEHERRRKAEKS